MNAARSPVPTMIFFWLQQKVLEDDALRSEGEIDLSDVDPDVSFEEKEGGAGDAAESSADEQGYSSGEEEGDEEDELSDEALSDEEIVPKKSEFNVWVVMGVDLFLENLCI